MWRTARILTDAARLLHGITDRRDIAATLLAAAVRDAADPGVISSLRALASPEGFGVLWAAAENTGGDGHTGAVAAVAAHDAMLVTGGEDGTVRIWDLTGHGLPGSCAGTRVGVRGSRLTGRADDRFRG